MRFLKRAVPVGITGGFFAAALFLIGLAWYPANAETPSQEGIDTALLLSVDQPVSPAPRTVPLEDDVQAEAAQPELATELNTWTFTGGHGDNDHHGRYPPPGPHPHPPHPPHPHHPPHPPHPHHHTPHH